jgi:ABC-type bacteriocin/lantibiotic exporter with double-glycine peptidase domain
LELEELRLDNNSTDLTDPIAVSISNGEFQWNYDESSNTPTLKSIDLEIPTGKFVCVVGAVGSGK